MKLVKAFVSVLVGKGESLTAIRQIGTINTPGFSPEDFPMVTYRVKPDGGLEELRLKGVQVEVKPMEQLFPKVINVTR